MKAWVRVWKFVARVLPVGAFVTILLFAHSALALLQVGDSNRQVEILQRRLQELGYFNGPITGYYGELTADAVEAFQSANGLAVDGIVGPQTEQALQLRGLSGESPSTVPLPPVPNAQPQTTPVPDPDLSRNNQRFPQGTASENFPIQRGDIGDRIVQLQQQLQAAGYYDGLINGIFDKRLEEAVEAFQEDNNLDDTGQVNRETQIALNRRQQEAQFLTPSGQPSSQPTTILERGDSSDAVLQVQKRLQELGYYDGRLSGHFGPKTEAAVIKFQQDRGFIGNGIVDTATRNAMGLLPPAAADEFPDAEETPANSDNFQLVPVPEN
ncbi:peptidoglycan-binding protein [Geitlerinema sp. PCC 9228]|uniref:peptidoglycan-binding domain-containing protein n=1 Tax=Geitlerinema sp. PCC 9228 TaxID=111611 RepID=UPI0008F99B60|nr:peptidoglycan-binding protein [Geitlerinema sp. PCC 9228]